MRTLVIAGEYPWPENSGSRIRLLTTLRGLRRCGPTELFCVVPHQRTDFDPPDQSLGLERVGRIGYDDSPASGLQLIATLARPSMPIGLPWRDRAFVGAGLERFATGQYDLVWCFGVRSWLLAGAPSFATTVLDFDDLEDQKILARLSVPRPPRPGVLGRARDTAGRFVSGQEARRWTQLYRRAGRDTATAVVCSGLDADRVRAKGLSRVEVVPNSYRAVDRPVGRIEVGSPPTVLFQGTLRYPPNAHAARFLVEEVGPVLRSLVPDLRIRLVGRAAPGLSHLHHPPAVTLVDQVPDIDVELARSDLVVVPVRFGSGTRVKILEAFAHMIPVVSTTLGAEGLDVQDGVHLLVADGACAMAAACARLLSEPTLRQYLTTRAHAHFLERFQSDVVEQQISRIARGLSGP